MANRSDTQSKSGSTPEARGQTAGSSPNYELRTVTDDQADVSLIQIVTPYRAGSGLVAPNDKYNIVYIILLIHGIGTLMPWNAFINAGDYFRDYKLSPGKDLDSEDLAKIRQDFYFYLGLSAQLPNVLFNGLNLVANVGSGNLGLRVNLTLAIELLVFALTVILAVVDTSTWAIVFFYITIFSVVILNMCSGIYQNCVFGLGAMFPGRYTNAILIGSNFCGTFTSVVNLISMMVMPDHKSSALFYFSTASLVLISCIITYNYLPMNAFYQHHSRISQRLSQSLTEEDHQDGDSKLETRICKPSSKLGVLAKCWPHCLNVFITFFVTLTIFPNVLTNIDLTESTAKLGLPDRYLIPFGCFLVFNSTALLGNILASYTKWPGKEHTWILVFARFIFIPLFLFFRFLPDVRKWPILIDSYPIFIVANVIFGLTSGYFSSTCMIFASEGLPSNEAPVAGMLASFFLVLGIFIGINSWTILKWIV